MIYDIYTIRLSTCLAKGRTRHLIAHITHSGDDMLAQCISKVFSFEMLPQKHAQITK